MPTPAPIATLWLLLLGVVDEVGGVVGEETELDCVGEGGDEDTAGVGVDIVDEAVAGDTPIVVKIDGFPLNRNTPTPLSQSQKLRLSVQQYVSEVLLLHLMIPAPPFGLSALLSICVAYASVERELSSTDRPYRTLGKRPQSMICLCNCLLRIRYYRLGHLWYSQMHIRYSTSRHTVARNRCYSRWKNRVYPD